MAAEGPKAARRGPSQEDLANLAKLISGTSIFDVHHGADNTTSSVSLSLKPNEGDKKSKRSSNSCDLWPDWRKRGRWVMEHKAFDSVMGVVVLFNLCLIVLDTDAEASCGRGDLGKCNDEVVRILNWGLLVLYTLECMARLIIYQSFFHKNRWNVADALVLAVCYVEALFWVVDLDGAAVQLQVIRIVRLGRLFRLVRVFRMFPELYAMIRGFLGTVFAIWWGFVFILLTLVLWAIIAVQFIQPDNERLVHESEWCETAFMSVENAVYFFFQTLVIGDSWGECTIPLMNESRLHFWLMSFAFITVQLGITNLILAVIVDTAARIRAEDIYEKAEELRQQQEEARSVLLEVAKSVDDDDSGDITCEEMLASFDENLDFQNIMRLIGFERDDMERMMSLMDVNRSGTVSYEEFIDSIAKAGKPDLGAQVMMMSLELKEISLLLKKSLPTSGFIDVDGALVQEHWPKEEGVGGVNQGKGVRHAGGFLPMPCGDVTDMAMSMSMSKTSLLKGLTDSSQASSVVALDHQLRLLGQMLADRLQAISADAEEELFRLACSARRLTFLPPNSDDASAALPISSDFADNLCNRSDVAGNTTLTLPAPGWMQQYRTQQQNRLGPRVKLPDALQQRP